MEFKNGVKFYCEFHTMSKDEEVIKDVHITNITFDDKYNNCDVTYRIIRPNGEIDDFTFKNITNPFRLYHTLDGGKYIPSMFL